MKKFEIINNSLVVTDTDTNKILFDNPKSEIYYNSGFLFLTPNEIRIVDLSSKYNNSIIFSCLLSDACNSLLVPFTSETFIDFARRNLGFKTASGGSDAIVYLSENYSALILEETAYLKVGDLAYVYNSQGTSWLPGTIGGTYYPSGFYVWNGTNWESDRNAIATQFDTNISSIVDLQNNKQDNLVSGTNIKTLEGQSILGSGNIDLTKSDVGLSNVQNIDTTTTANITDSINKRFVTDTQITNINNQSGTNTGDETTLSIQTKRPLKTIENQSLEGSGNIDLNKTDVGLANVDNTSDLNKPISTATQTALNLKQDTLVSGINIKTVNSNSLLGTGDVSVGTVTSVSALTIGTAGTNISSSVATDTTTPVITLNIPTASATNRGALSSADWTTFNNKQNALTNPITGTGASGRVAFFNGTTTQISDTNLFWDNTNKRLGIGTTSPTSTLHVAGTANITGNLTVDTSTFFVNASTNRVGIGTTTPNALLDITGSETGVLFYAQNLDSVANSFFDVQRNSGKLGIGWNRNGGAGQVDFFSNRGAGGGGGFAFFDVTNTANTAPNHLMTILGNGNVGIGQTTPLHTLHTNGDAFFEGAQNIWLRGKTQLGQDGTRIHNNVGNTFFDNKGVGGIIFRNDNSNGDTERMRITTTGITVTGNIVATGTITPSDKRLKSNIKNIDNISEKFNKLRPVSYDKKHGLNSENSNFEYGFIADEFIELFPELVTEYGEDKIKAINYTSIIALLVKEIQTLKSNNYVQS